MKKYFFFPFLFLFFLFLSCGGDIKISVYTRDLSDVMAVRENVIYTNANMIVESLSDENDIDFLRRNLNGFSNEHTVDYNYSTSLSFDIKIPIVREGADLDFSKDLLILVGKNNNGKTDWYLKYNKELFSRINGYIYNSHYQNIDLYAFKIKLEINNDERRTVYLESFSSYVNGRAYPFSYKDAIAERGRISLEVSEIFAKYISDSENEDYPLFIIR